MEYSIIDIAAILQLKTEDLKPAVVKELLTDSRTLTRPEDSLFFAIKTATNDGHKYIADLYELNVRNFVVSDLPVHADQMVDANFLVVKSPLRALQKIAATHRAKFDIPVIGITGSNGKTIVKEFLYQLLHDDFNIVRSPRSYNSQIGVPLSVWQMNEKHSLGIFEAGISQPDEMEYLEPIIRPTIGVLTNIGEAHQENFDSAWDKCMEKLLLFKDCEAIIYNEDDHFITGCIESSCLSHKALAWSMVDSDAPLFIESITKKDTETEIQCTLLGLSQTFTIPFTDDASIEDLIHCLAVMLYIKPTVSEDKHLFRTLDPVAMRMEIKEGIHGCQLINDAYNSDLNALEIALAFMKERKGSFEKTTVILSDIEQTGLPAETLYRRVNELLKKKKVDRIIGVGADLFAARKIFSMPGEFFLTTDELIRSGLLHRIDKELILVKGARRFHFEQITELIEKKVHETVLEVNLDALVHNYNYFRSQLNPSTRMVCMVKAFGYGVGAHELAKTLQKHHCDYLAVAVADEGRELRNKGIYIPIIVMNPEMSSLNTLFDNRLEPEVYSFRLLEQLIYETERRGITNYPIHLKIDTGMHRLGFQPDGIEAVVQMLGGQSGVEVQSVFSHLVGSDEELHDDFTLQQIDLFKTTAETLETGLGRKVIKHILNSAGIERFLEYQLDMVRLGISLYGISASGLSDGQLKNVSSLKTTILQIQEVKKGQSVGYGRMTYLERDSRIAVISIGYADGFNRLLGKGNGEVIVNGTRCPVVGNVCMDLSMIDITDVDAKEGDYVTIFGDELSVFELADRLNTIPYEVLTSISPRVKRVYYKE